MIISNFDNHHYLYFNVICLAVAVWRLFLSSVCLSVSLIVHLSVSLSICLTDGLQVFCLLSFFLSVCLSVSPSFKDRKSETWEVSDSSLIWRLSCYVMLCYHHSKSMNNDYWWSQGAYSGCTRAVWRRHFQSWSRVCCRVHAQISG